MKRLKDGIKARKQRYSIEIEKWMAEDLCSELELACAERPAASRLQDLYSALQEIVEDCDDE